MWFWDRLYVIQLFLFQHLSGCCVTLNVLLSPYNYIWQFFLRTFLGNVIIGTVFLLVIQLSLAQMLEKRTFEIIFFWNHSPFNSMAFIVVWFFLNQVSVPKEETIFFKEKKDSHKLRIVFYCLIFDQEVKWSCGKIG